MDKKTKTKPSDQSGFVLPLVLVIIGLIAVVTVYMINRATTASKQAIYSNGAFQAANILKEVTGLINDTTAWNTHTLWGNPSMACLGPTPTASCSAYTGNGSTVVIKQAYPSTVTGAIKLYDHAGKIFYDSTVATNGFDYTGQPCPYSAANSYSNSSNTAKYGDSSGLCPFRLVLYWVPSCAGQCKISDGSLTTYTVYGYLLFTPVTYVTSTGTSASTATYTQSLYRVPFSSYNYSLGVSGGGILKSTTASTGDYCCAMECKHLTGDSGTAYVTQTISNSSDCYPGSSEVSASICSDVFAGDPTDWAYDGNNTTNAGTCGGG